MWTYNYTNYNTNILCHHGVKGMKWGIRKYQNPDGSITKEGKARYYDSNGKFNKKLYKQDRKEAGEKSFYLKGTNKAAEVESYRSLRKANGDKRAATNRIVGKTVGLHVASGITSAIGSKGMNDFAKEYEQKGEDGKAFAFRMGNIAIKALTAASTAVSTVHMVKSINRVWKDDLQRNKNTER